MRKLLVITLLFALTFVSGHGQQNGYLHIIQDPAIDSLLMLNRKIYLQLTEREQGFMDGYRIQIFMESGNDAIEHAEEVIEKFHRDYPHIKAYLTYRQPYYRVRIGDFRDRLEAEGFLRRISRSYGQAFVVREKIRPPQLLYFRNQNQEL